MKKFLTFLAVFAFIAFAVPTLVNASQNEKWSPCQYCGASGRCSQCGGIGQVVYGYDEHGFPMQILCGSCNGSGTCSMCAGTGNGYNMPLYPSH